MTKENSKDTDTDNLNEMMERHAWQFKHYVDEGLFLPRGWHSIVMDMCALLEDNVALHIRDDFSFLSIKEKFNQLRIVWVFDRPRDRDASIALEYIEYLISQKQIDASYTCPSCGDCNERRQAPGSAPGSPFCAQHDLVG